MRAMNDARRHNALTVQSDAPIGVFMKRWAGAVLLTLVIQLHASAKSNHFEELPADFQEILPEQESAIERGAAWLAKQQSRNGSWTNTGGENYPCAMTGLAGLALLAQGSTPRRGKYGRHVEQAIHFLLQRQDSTGHITSPDEGRSMYGHGFAMTFLAECYGMTKEEDLSAKLKRCLEKAIKLTARAQSQLGGWNYAPDSGGDEGSVTITQVQALRACQNVNIDVPYKTLENAINYIKKSQQPDGGIAYRAGMTGSRPSLSAAGAELLMMAGLYDARETRKVIEYVRRQISSENTRQQHDSYTTFYAAQALHQIGGNPWVLYFGSRRIRYLREQGRDGSWTYTGWGASPVFDTSIAVITLSLPYGYLPIYQR